MKKQPKQLAPYTFKDLLVGYIFSMLALYAGVYLSTFLLSVVGLKGKSEALWMGLSVLVGLIAAFAVTVRTESANETLRTAYHKAVDEGREREVASVRALIKRYRPLIDPLTALLAALLILIPRGAVESDVVFVLLTNLISAPVMMILRLPAMIVARKKWAKEHIKK